MMLHVDPYKPVPENVRLYILGESYCYVPVWTWGVMNDGHVWAFQSERVEDKAMIDATYRSSIYMPLVALGYGLTLLKDRGLDGDLEIMTHKPLVEVAMKKPKTPIARRCVELAAGLCAEWKIKLVDFVEMDWIAHINSDTYWKKTITDPAHWDKR